MKNITEKTNGIYLALPCMDGRVEKELMDSIIGLYLLCKEKKIPLIHTATAGCSLISKGRTDMSNLFYYETGFSHFLFIDSDLQFDPKDIIEMYESKKDIIAGTYVKKSLNWKKIQSDIIKSDINTNDSDNLLINSGDYCLVNLTGKKGDKIMKADYAATGMLMINRKVFTALQRYMDEEYFMVGKNKYYNYFETMLYPLQVKRNFYLSEDYASCQRARFAGFDINILMDCNTTHYGRFGFKGNLKKYIENGNR